MNTANPKSSCLPRLGRLAACVTFALATADTTAQSLVAAPLPTALTSTRTLRHGLKQLKVSGQSFAATGNTLAVTSCADNEAVGTLRSEIFLAADGDTVDLSQLSCSTITLANGAFTIGANRSLRIIASPSNPITIDAHGASRVIDLTITDDQLYLQNLKLTNGYFRNDDPNSTAQGGCIDFRGFVTLKSTLVSGCKVVNSSGPVRGGAIVVSMLNMYDSEVTGSVATGLNARGGGIYSQGGDAYLRDSTVSGNQALSSASVISGYAQGGGMDTFVSDIKIVRSTVVGNIAQANVGVASGGGIFSHYGNHVDVAFSTISGNRAVSPASSGGGMRTRFAANITYSTLEHNQSVNNSALVIAGSAQIRNSTISGNTATTGSSTIYARISMAVDHSTIAFNVAKGTSAGIYLYADATVDLESTIIANNTSTSGGGFDLVSHTTVTGAYNLVRNPASALPANVATMGVDPLLAPLANNGGPTKTHALQTGSPAIDAGKNPQFLPYDQRGPGFGRVVGAASDIGAYESDPDRIFTNGFE